MGSVLLTSWVFASTAGAAEPCPSPEARRDLVVAAENSVMDGDLPGADQKLRELEGAFACGTLADADVLTRMWLVEGAALALGSDPSAASSWQAAARTSPGVWTDRFGGELRKKYDQAVAARESGAAPTPLTVDPALVRWVAAVDGRVVSALPAEVEPGLHLVQVGASTTDIRFARVVLAVAGTPVVVVTRLTEPTTVAAPAPAPGPVPAPVAAPVPVPVPPVRSEHAPLALHLATGGAVGFGQAPEGGDEPGVKIVVPFETGFVVRPVDRAWIRAAVRAGLLVNGAYAYEDDFGATTSPSTVGADLAGGLAIEQADLGLLVGYHWPERLAFRATGSIGAASFPARAEGRLGVDLPNGGTPEPTVEVLLAVTPRLIRHR